MDDAPAIDIADLASKYDEESRNAFVSLYADFSDGALDKTLERRAKEIEGALDAPERKEWTAAWEEAKRLLSKVPRGGDVRAAAIFTSPRHGFARVHRLAAPVPTRLVFDTSPYVRPLARFVDEYEAFILVLLDGRRGAVFLVDEARAERVARRQTKLIGRHRNGGMSQMRYQRHRQGVVDRYLDDLIDHADRVAREENVHRLVLAGPGDAKRRLADRLPPSLRDALEAVEDVDFQDGISDALVRRFVELGRELESQDSAEAVRALRGALRSGDLVAVGPFEAVRAARDGRVDLLVVQREVAAGGRKCEEHQTLFAPDAACACGNVGTDVDLVNEAIEYAARSDARLEFVPADDEWMRSLGGAAALLRW